MYFSLRYNRVKMDCFVLNFLVTDILSILQCLDLGSIIISLLTKHSSAVSWGGWLHSTVAERRYFAGKLPSPALFLQLSVDHLCGKPSAVGQPTKPTQPFILLGLINE